METIERKTVFVIGAGASKEFGLPVGDELKDQIAEIADINFDDFGNRLKSGDPIVTDALRICAREMNSETPSINPFLHGAWKIRDNMQLAPSIDNFLDTHQKNAELVRFGKIALTHAILKAEQNSLLSSSGLNGSDFYELSETWIVKLFKILVAQRDFEDFLKALGDISFISFNYDRCIHQFFLVASKNYFSLELSDVERVLNALNIIYPYGSVGPVVPDDFGVRGFGKIAHGEILLERSDKIRTFTEGLAQGCSFHINDAFNSADAVVFLGFGYLPLNMEMLFGNFQHTCFKVLGTTKGMSENSIEQLSFELRGVFGQHNGGDLWKTLDEIDLHLMSVTCSELINHFQRFLSSKQRVVEGLHY